MGIRTKIRNRMSDDTMQMQTQVKMMLFDDPEVKEKFKKSKLSKQDHLARTGSDERVQAEVGNSTEHDLMELFDEFTNSTLSVADLEEAEELSYSLEGNAQDLTVPLTRLNARIDTLFDFDLVSEADEDLATAEAEGPLNNLNAGANGNIDINSFNFD
jgi:hypothetical protein